MDTSVADRGGSVNVLVGVYANDVDVHGGLNWSLRSSPGRLHGPDDRQADRTVTGWLPSSSYKALAFRQHRQVLHRRTEKSTR